MDARKMYERYEELRNQFHMTNYQVHQKTGIPQSTLSNWKTGGNAPKVDKIMKLCALFNVSVSFFYEEG